MLKEVIFFIYSIDIDKQKQNKLSKKKKQKQKQNRLWLYIYITSKLFKVKITFILSSTNGAKQTPTIFWKQLQIKSYLELLLKKNRFFLIGERKLSNDEGNFIRKNLFYIVAFKQTKLFFF